MKGVATIKISFAVLQNVKDRFSVRPSSPFLAITHPPQNKTKLGAGSGVCVNIFNPSTRDRGRWVLCVFKANLLYTVSSGLARATH